MEDDILIEDIEFFFKKLSSFSNTAKEYAIVPHRCEYISHRGYVILSGIPRMKERICFGRLERPFL